MARTPILMFQFHNGAIKRDESNILQESLDLFQFHNGAIKSVSLFVS